VQKLRNAALAEASDQESKSVFDKLGRLNPFQPKDKKDENAD